MLAVHMSGEPLKHKRRGLIKWWGLFMLISMMTYIFSTPAMAQTAEAVYHFETDQVNSTPRDVRMLRGKAKVTGPIRAKKKKIAGKSLVFQGNSYATARLTRFPPSKDYIVSWKEITREKRKTGVLLRGQSLGSDKRMEGYLFRTSHDQGMAHIFKFQRKTGGFTLLGSARISTPSKNQKRSYRAKAVESTLTLQVYNNSQKKYVDLIVVEDNTFNRRGHTLITQGYGKGVGSSFIDEIRFTGYDDKLSISNLSNYQVIQRDRHTNLADIQISGRYITKNGASPGPIEASYDGSDYQVIDTSPAGGTFSGVIRDVRGGQQGKLHVRVQNDHHVEATVQHLGIGDIFMVSGQSNAVGKANKHNAYKIPASHPHLRASMYTISGEWNELKDPVNLTRLSASKTGSHYPLIATRILENHKVPVAFVGTAWGGTIIENWQPSSPLIKIWVKSKPYYKLRDLVGPTNENLYGRLVRMTKGVGGNVTANLFFQGESNALPVGHSQTTQKMQQYGNQLGVIVDGFHREFGAKTLIGQIGDRPNRNNSKYNSDGIRASQVAVIESYPNALLGPAMYDVNLQDEKDENSDGSHYKSVKDNKALADRWYAIIDKTFYGGEDGYGPIVDTLKYDDARNIISVTFTDDSTPALSKTRSTVRPRSFRLKNGRNLSVTNVEIVRNNTIEIVPSQKLDTSEEIYLTYGSLNDGVDAAIYDPHGLPAQPFYNRRVSVD